MGSCWGLRLGDPRQELASEPTASRLTVIQHLHWRWGSINPMLGFVGLAWGLSTSCCPVQPCVGAVGSIENPLGFEPPLRIQLRIWCFIVALGWPHTPALVQESW